jgi:transketolase C-terminal domain/subunit
MRKLMAEYLNEDDYLLHADMFNTKNFPTKAKVINTGLGEGNLLNIAGGLTSLGNTIYIYGVSGFIIHRYEQLKFSCRDFGSKKGKIIICNAGKYGYDNLGNGHKLDDDLGIMELLNIEYFQPETLQHMQNILEDLDKKENGIYYIQLGKDLS